MKDRITDYRCCSSPSRRNQELSHTQGLFLYRSERPAEILDLWSQMYESLVRIRQFLHSKASHPVQGLALLAMRAFQGRQLDLEVAPHRSLYCRVSLLQDRFERAVGLLQVHKLSLRLCRAAFPMRACCRLHGLFFRDRLRFLLLLQSTKRL